MPYSLRATHVDIQEYILRQHAFSPNPAAGDTYGISSLVRQSVSLKLLFCFRSNPLGGTNRNDLLSSAQGNAIFRRDFRKTPAQNPGQIPLAKKNWPDLTNKAFLVRFETLLCQRSQQGLNNKKPKQLRPPASTTAWARGREKPCLHRERRTVLFVTIVPAKKGNAQQCLIRC